MDKASLPLLNFSRDFNNRLLILVETDGAARSEKIDDVVTAVTQQARQAPEGEPSSSESMPSTPSSPMACCRPGKAHSRRE